ncbi:MAG: GntR family transcriptional regulator [Burkholderiales bacterium]|jgi:DNA-binding FadR family transcriptional regulator
MAKTPSRSALLARDLLGRIARRELQPGDPIDVQALGRRHGVSRTVVREALADLGGKGLVVARPKVGTTVAPEVDWNLLDPTLVAVAIAEPGPESMLAEAVELRRLIEPALASDAARDAGRPRQQAILQAVRALADAVGAADPTRFRDAGLAVHAAVAEACGNRLLRSIDHALVPVRALHLERLAAAQLVGGSPGPDILRTLTLQTSLGLAIARREPAIAAAHAHAIASIAPGPAPGSTRDAGASAVPFPDAPALAVVPTFLQAAAGDDGGVTPEAADAVDLDDDDATGADHDTPVADAGSTRLDAIVARLDPGPVEIDDRRITAVSASTDAVGELDPLILELPDLATGAFALDTIVGPTPVPDAPTAFAPDAPHADPSVPRIAPGPAGPPAHVDPEIADDWPPTETLVRDGAPLEPLRRATLEPDDSPPAFAVPALLGEPSRRTALR